MFCLSSRSCGTAATQSRNPSRLFVLRRDVCVRCVKKIAQKLRHRFESTRNPIRMPEPGQSYSNIPTQLTIAIR